VYMTPEAYKSSNIVSRKELAYVGAVATGVDGEYIAGAVPKPEDEIILQVLEALVKAPWVNNPPDHKRRARVTFEFSDKEGNFDDEVPEGDNRVAVTLVFDDIVIAAENTSDFSTWRDNMFPLTGKTLAFFGRNKPAPSDVSLTPAARIEPQP